MKSFWIYLFWGLFIVAVSHSAGQTPEELRLKTAYIEKICRFIAWPADYLENPETFRLALMVRPQYEKIITRFYNERTIKGRGVSISFYPLADALDSSHVLLVDSSRAAEFMQLEPVDNPHLLIIGDFPNAAGTGAHIGFEIQNNRYGLEMNLHAIRLLNLDIESVLYEYVNIIREPWTRGN